MAPRTLQDGPKTPQDGPKRLQDGPRRPQDGSKTAPRRPKTAPRWPQDGPQKTLRRPKIPKMPLPRDFSPRAHGVPPSPPRFSGHGPIGYPPSSLIFDRFLASLLMDLESIFDGFLETIRLQCWGSCAPPDPPLLRGTHGGGNAALPR